MHTSMPRPQQAFTLIELLVVISIIAVLSGMLLAGVSMVRANAARTSTQGLINILHGAMEAYRTSDPRSAYPPEATDMRLTRSASGTTAIDLLDGMQLLTLTNNSLSDGVVIDAWKNPVRYSLSRPAIVMTTQGNRLRGLDASGSLLAANQRSTWNWSPDPDGNGDPSDGQARRRGLSRSTSGGIPKQADLPFPYIWSWGSHGREDETDTWIYHADAP